MFNYTSPAARNGYPAALKVVQDRAIDTKLLHEHGLHNVHGSEMYKTTVTHANIDFTFTEKLSHVMGDLRILFLSFCVAMDIFLII